MNLYNCQWHKHIGHFTISPALWSKVDAVEPLLDEQLARPKKYFEALGWKVRTVQDVQVAGTEDLQVAKFARDDVFLLNYFFLVAGACPFSFHEAIGSAKDASSEEDNMVDSRFETKALMLGSQSAANGGVFSLPRRIKN